MASPDLKEELNCSVCQQIFTDPVTLQCGHSFCIKCISQTWDKQEEKESSCPECRHKYRRRPELRRNQRLSNIAEGFHLFQTPHEEHQSCSICINSPISGTKSCLLCEASLCEQHLHMHSRSPKPEQILADTNTVLQTKKCLNHQSSLKFYCFNDGACICMSCLMCGKHKGHKVELLSEVLKRKMLKLRNLLEKLNIEKKESGKTKEILNEHITKIQENATCEKECISELFCAIRERFEALEKKVLNEISRQAFLNSFRISDLIHKLQLKQNKLSNKIHHIEALCNSDFSSCRTMSGFSNRAAMFLADMTENKGGKTDYINIPSVGDLDMDLISERLQKGLNDIVTEVTSKDFISSKCIQKRRTHGISKLSSGNNESRSRAASNSLWNKCSNTEKVKVKKKSSSLHLKSETECGTIPHVLATGSRELLTNSVITVNNEDIPKMKHNSSLPDIKFFCIKESLSDYKKTDFQLSKRLHKPTAQKKKTSVGSDETVEHSTSFMTLTEAPMELLLDINTAANNVAVSEDRRTASYSETDQCRLQTPERFHENQVLSIRSLSRGRLYWNMEVSESGDLWVGVAYPSIERREGQCHIGNNDKSWGLYRSTKLPTAAGWSTYFSVRHNSKLTHLPYHPSSQRIKIILDYETGSLSFFELRNPIRHLHTFTATFTEPLHAAFWVGAGAFVRIISSI